MGITVSNQICRLNWDGDVDRPVTTTARITATKSKTHHQLRPRHIVATVVQHRTPILHPHRNRPTFGGRKTQHHSLFSCSQVRTVVDPCPGHKLARGRMRCVAAVRTPVPVARLTSNLWGKYFNHRLPIIFN